jgi:propionaldehyde dehydrogenase
MAIDEKRIADIVEEVIRQIMTKESVGLSGDKSVGNLGIFKDVDSAVEAADAAYRKLLKEGIDARERYVNAIRKVSIEKAEYLAKIAFEETGMGRYEDKIGKNKDAARLTPGTEDIKAEVKTGDDGMTLVERAPYGVLCAITPVTNPTSTIINNSIMMIAAGNSIFFCPHPRGLKTSIETIKILNKALIEAGAPENLLTCVEDASLDTVDKGMKHPKVKLVVGTGGPGMVKAALTSGKRAICAGPGNPTVIVDETADLEKAASDIITGASFDNNMPCILEKTTIVIDSVADGFIRAFEKAGAYHVKGMDVDRLTKVIFPEGKLNKKLVGQNPSKILKEIGIEISDTVRLAFMEVPKDHQLALEEQLMPVMPVVRAKDFEEALDLAERYEHGFHHTALIHSKNIDRITCYAKRIQTTVFIVNGQCHLSDNLGQLFI